MKTSSPFASGSAVIVYLRHSPGEDQTIASQESAVRAWCGENSLVIARVYCDEAKSGTSTTGRDDFLAMVDALRDGTILPRPAGVIVWSLSRFAREFDDASFYTALIRRAGYRVHSITEQISDDNVGRVIESLYHFQAAEQSRKISADARRGKRWLAEQGYCIGGFPPRGYLKSPGIEVGRRKNGEPRIAYKLIFDDALEPRVRRAWQMKLAGATTWQVHNELKIFAGVNSYTTFWNNITYAGFIKCDDLTVPNAHPAYITVAEFERVQNLRRALAHNPKAPDGDPNHSRRAQSPFLLSGLLYCSCGSAMSGQTNGEHPFYRCGRKQRQGPHACDGRSVVAWYVEEFVLDWVCANVFTREVMRASRDDINARIGGDRSVLESRRTQIKSELETIDRRVKNLLDSIERIGLNEDVESRLRERKIEAKQLEVELAEIDARLAQGRVEISDEAIDYLAERMRDEMQNSSLEDTRCLLRQVLVRAELNSAQNEMTLWYVSPLLEKPKSVIKTVPPRRFELRSWP